MYIPAYASVQELPFLLKFIREHSFGTLVGPDLNANHYPFLLTEEGEDLVLWTHLARSNSQWRDLGGQSCLVVFSGPHGYISPGHYVNPLNVPTWSYTAVHARGEVSIVADPLLAQQRMNELVNTHEAHSGTDWKYELPEDFHRQLLAAIVWLRIRVTKIEGKFKLSQNRKREDYDRLVEGLSGRPGYEELLSYMRLTDPFRNDRLP